MRVNLRRQDRSSLILSSLLLILIVLLSSCGDPTTVPEAAVIPPTTVPTTTSSVPPSTIIPATAKPASVPTKCGPDDLEVKASWQQTGSVYPLSGYLSFRNRGTVACQLAGPPQVTITDEKGSVLPVAAKLGATGSSEIYKPLAADQKVSAFLIWRYWTVRMQPQPVGVLRLRVSLPGLSEPLTVPVTGPDGTASKAVPGDFEDGGSPSSTLEVGLYETGDSTLLTATAEAKTITAQVVLATGAARATAMHEAQATQTASVPATPTIAASAKPCRLADVFVNYGTNGAGGHLFLVLTFTPQKPLGCTLQGWPEQLQMVDRQQRPLTGLTIRNGAITTEKNPGLRFGLRPDQSANLSLILTNWCGGKKDGVQVKFWLPGDTTPVIIPFEEYQQARCDVPDGSADLLVEPFKAT